MIQEIPHDLYLKVIKALKIDVPVYSAIQLKDGSVQIVTRNGTQTWKPPKKKKAAKSRKPKAG